MPARFLPLIAPMVLALAAWSCAGSGGRVMRAPDAPPDAPPAAASTDPTRAALEGEWRLVAMQTADGGSRKVTGFLRYDRFATLTPLEKEEYLAKASQHSASRLDGMREELDALLAMCATETETV